jgi:hypothetical protein
MAMWFKALWESWKSVHSRSRRPQPKRRGARLLLEHLEDRNLPSVYNAANVAQLIADINAANKAGGSNTIILTAPASTPYALTAANNSTDGPTGLPVISGKNKSHPDNLTIIGNGDTIERSTAYGTPLFRLFEVASGATLTLENLTLTGGSVQVYLYYSQPIGGGAVCNFGTLVLDGVTVAVNGVAGIQGQGYPFNSPGFNAVGGAIWSSGSLTLENGTLLEDNHALGADGDSFGDPASGALGGALYVAGGTVNISNTTLSNNSAVAGLAELLNGANAFGGAIYVAGGSVTITTSTVSQNDASANWQPGTSGGGGLYIASAATVYLDAFTAANILNNTALTNPNIDGQYTML